MFCQKCGSELATPGSYSTWWCVGCGAAVGSPLVELRDDGHPADKVGAGRYILSFMLAGLIGLWIQYWTRNYGWRGVAINAAIFGVLVVVLVAASASGEQDCYDAYGDYTC